MRLKYDKGVLESRQWILYRNDPRLINKGRNRSQLYSEKPSLYINTHMKIQNRFDMITAKNQSVTKYFFRNLQAQVDTLQ